MRTSIYSELIFFFLKKNHLLSSGFDKLNKTHFLIEMSSHQLKAWQYMDKPWNWAYLRSAYSNADISVISIYDIFTINYSIDNWLTLKCTNSSLKQIKMKLWTRTNSIHCPKSSNTQRYFTRVTYYLYILSRSPT